MKLLVIAFALVAAACSVEHRSGELVCTKQADCPSGRLCQDGFCIYNGPIDAAINDGKTGDGRPDAFACPADCTSCNPANMTCNIDCTQRNCTTTNPPVTCPPGWKCTIACSTPGSCRDLDCSRGDSCTVTCTGTGSCRDAVCGNNRPCDFTCSGDESCRGVNCSASCGCDVRCEAQSSCPFQSSCPGLPGMCDTFDNGCTSDGACNTCL